MIGKLPVSLGGGVNVFDDPAAIADGQWQRLRNLATRQTGVLGQRQSMTFVRELQPSWWHWDARTLAGQLGVASAVEDYWRWAEGLRPLRFLFDPNFAEISMVAMTTIPRLVSNETASGIQTAVTVPDGTLLLITLPGTITGNGAGNLPSLRCAVLGQSTSQPSLFTFNGETYGFAGGNHGAHVEAALSAPVEFSYVVNDFGTGNEAFNPDGGCVVRDRVLYYIGQRVYWSDRNDPLTVSVAGVPAIGTRDIFLGGEELENITAAAEISTTADGSPVQSVAAVWTNNHCYLLLGEPRESANPDADGGYIGSLQINRLNIQAGCVSQATVTRTPYGTFWAGTDDVWFMPYGNLPIRVGTSIRPLLKDQPSGLQWRMHAEYSDGFYRLSMFTPGQGPTMYDPCGMQMWLDLRKGPPGSAEQAVWVGPQEFVQTDAPSIGGDEQFGGQAGVWCMARDTRGTGDGRLYALQRYVMGASSASADPDIKGMTLCAFDEANGRDTCAPQGVTRPYATFGTTYYEGDIHVPVPNSSNILSPVYLCTQGGPVISEPNWFAPDAQGRVFDGAFIIWTLLYFDGTNAMSGYMPSLVQGNNQIELSFLSKELMLGDPTKEKLMDGAELGYWAQDRTQLTYNSHPKQDSRSRVLSLSAEQVADNVANQTTGDRVWQRKLLTTDPTKRFHGLSAIWECAQDAGIVITEGVNDTIRVEEDQQGISTITIPAGFYADLATVAQAISTSTNISGTPMDPLYCTVLDDGGYVRALVGFKVNPSGSELRVYTDSRLAQLFGFSPAQGVFVAASEPNYTFGYESPRTKLAPDMQFSGLNLRFKVFNRGPT